MYGWNDISSILNRKIERISIRTLKFWRQQGFLNLPSMRRSRKPYTKKNVYDIYIASVLRLKVGSCMKQVRKTQIIEMRKLALKEKKNFSMLIEEDGAFVIMGDYVVKGKTKAKIVKFFFEELEAALEKIKERNIQ